MQDRRRPGRAVVNFTVWRHPRINETALLDLERVWRMNVSDAVERDGVGGGDRRSAFEKVDASRVWSTL